MQLVQFFIYSFFISFIISLATGRVSHARQVKNDDPEKKGYPGPPGRGSVTGRISQVIQSYPRE